MTVEFFVEVPAGRISRRAGVGRGEQQVHIMPESLTRRQSRDQVPHDVPGDLMQNEAPGTETYPQQARAPQAPDRTGQLDRVPQQVVNRNVLEEAATFERVARDEAAASDLYRAQTPILDQFVERRTG